MATKPERLVTDAMTAPHETPEPETPASVPLAPPTLDEAFHTLCQALYPLLDEDLPRQMRSEEIRGWYQDGNHAIAWTHAMMLLESVLGVRLSTP